MISIGTQDKQVYKYMSEGETLKAIKESSVMMKVKLEDVLYTLARSTFFGSLNAFTMQLSDDGEERLWNMRLGLLNARGPKIL